MGGKVSIHWRIYLEESSWEKYRTSLQGKIYTITNSVGGKRCNIEATYAHKIKASKSTLGGQNIDNKQHIRWTKHVLLSSVKYCSRWIAPREVSLLPHPPREIPQKNLHQF